MPLFRFALWVAFLLLLVPVPVPATLAAAALPAELAAELAAAPGGRVATVTDGDTLTLADGREIRLVGIQAPKLPLGRAGFAPWPLAEEAKRFLEALTAGRTLELGFGGRRGDRHGRVLAHLFVVGAEGEGRWIQGEILRAGLARVYSFADNRALIPEMLALEQEARAARRGIWADPFYALRSAEDAGRWLGGFELVEGRVFAVGRAGSNTYLNFAEDWREDFTVVIDRQAARLFAAAGIDPAAYEGKKLRVRGWLKSRNGPMIEASHPEQIEELEE
jgi:endonuclease YncB( thermonuclease family)